MKRTVRIFMRKQPAFHLLFYPEMRLHDRIQLCGYVGKILIQIQRPYADLIPAHLIIFLRLYHFVGTGIEQHTGNLLLRLIGLFVFDVDENLIQIM